jgi:predicted RNase H-like HicB family nuclease
MTTSRSICSNSTEQILDQTPHTPGIRLEGYVVLPFDYCIVLEQIPKEYGGGFVASVAELNDCIGSGVTPEAAVENLRKAVAEWKLRAACAGYAIPTPIKRDRI